MEEPGEGLSSAVGGPWAADADSAAVSDSFRGDGRGRKIRDLLLSQTNGKCTSLLDTHV